MFVSFNAERLCAWEPPVAINPCFKYVSQYCPVNAALFFSVVVLLSPHSSAIVQFRSTEFCSIFDKPSSNHGRTGPFSELPLLPTPYMRACMLIHTLFHLSFSYTGSFLDPRCAPSAIWHARSVGSHLAALR